MTGCNLPHNWQEIACCQPNRNRGALGGGPQPIYGPIPQPGLLMWLLKGEAQAEHPRPLLPAVEQGAALRAIKGEVPQYRQAVGVLAGGLDRHLVGFRVPAWRMN